MDRIITATRIIGSDTVFLAVWEPTIYTGPHQTVSSLGLGRGAWGRMDTVRPDVEDMLPGSPERREFVRAHYARVSEEAVRLIHATVGRIGETKPHLGEVRTTVDELDAFGWSSLLDAPAEVPA